MKIADIDPISPYWYLATPYSKWEAGIAAAFTEACKVAGALIGRGIGVYSPIAHTHPIALSSGLDPLDHSIWLRADAPLMRAAGGLIVAQMPGWDDSYGIAYEMREFADARKPIILLEWPL